MITRYSQPIKLNKDGHMQGIVTKPKPQQKLAVDLILSGKAKSLRDAARQAGYKKDSVHNVHRAITHAVGVRVYLAKLDQKAKEKFGMSLPDKVADTFFKGLNATKLYGKDAVKHVDYATRLQYADRFARFFKWETTGIEDGKSEYNQFNFFQAKPEDQEKFHANLKSFIKRSYGDKI